jgi:hypothetical protein
MIVIRKLLCAAQVWLAQQVRVPITQTSWLLRPAAMSISSQRRNKTNLTSAIDGAADQRYSLPRAVNLFGRTQPTRHPGANRVHGSAGTSDRYFSKALKFWETTGMGAT